MEKETALTLVYIESFAFSSFQFYILNFKLLRCINVNIRTFVSEVIRHPESDNE